MLHVTHHACCFMHVACTCTCMCSVLHHACCMHMLCMCMHMSEGRHA